MEFIQLYPTRIQPEQPIAAIEPVGGGGLLLLCFLGFGIFYLFHLSLLRARFSVAGLLMLQGLSDLR